MSPVRSRSPAPISRAKSDLGSASLFRFDYEISYSFAVSYQGLVWQSGWNVNDVPDFHFLARSALDRLAPISPGPIDFSSTTLPPVTTVACPSRITEHVGKVLVQLAASAFLAEGKHGVVVRILFQSLAG